MKSKNPPIKPNPARNWSVEFRDDGDKYHQANFVGTFDQVLARVDEEECEVDWQVTRVCITALGGAVSDAEVDRLVCGNVDDLRIYLKGVTDRNLVSRCIERCRTGCEMKTKLQILERHLRKLNADKREGSS